MQRSEDEKSYTVTNEEQDDSRTDQPLLKEDEKLVDAESQIRRKADQQNESRSRMVAYLGMYFLMNLSLTFYNKLVLGKVSFRVDIFRDES